MSTTTLSPRPPITRSCDARSPARPKSYWVKTPFPEIQSTTGPGNLTAALAAHARYLQLEGLPFDFELLRDWESIAEMRWDLSYRADFRNWRNVHGC